MSLQIHPDRVADPGEKEKATEKFKVLTKIKSVLINKEKKALYDKKGIFDDDDDSHCMDASKLWQFSETATNMQFSDNKQNYIGK